MLLYSLLHLSGYKLSLEDLQHFHSEIPDHPELGYTSGVETTTGPLGQDLANAESMAIAERTLLRAQGGRRHADADPDRHRLRGRPSDGHRQG